VTLFLLVFIKDIPARLNMIKFKHSPTPQENRYPKLSGDRHLNHIVINDDIEISGADKAINQGSNVKPNSPPPTIGFRLKSIVLKASNISASPMIPEKNNIPIADSSARRIRNQIVSGPTIAATNKKILILTTITPSTKFYSPLIISPRKPMAHNVLGVPVASYYDYIGKLQESYVR
jgi:hypothetical protein